VARTARPVQLRVAAVLLALIAGACGVESYDSIEKRREEPGAIPTLAPDVDLPDLVVASGSEVYRYVDGSLIRLGAVEGEATVAVDGGDGSIFVQREYDGSEHYSKLVRLSDGVAKSVLTPPAPRIYLFERALLGTSKLLFATERDHSQFVGDNWGQLWLYDIATGATQGVTQAFGPEYFTTRASYGAGVFALTASCDLTECLRYVNPDGDEVEGLPNPTDDLEYAMPPLVTDVVFSPDGATIAYLEGPDVNTADPEVLIGDWTLVLINRSDGRELLRLRVAGQDSRVRRLDFDGRWVFLSMAKGSVFDAGEDLAALAVDTSATSPEVQQLSKVVGVVSIANRPAG
jgi:hypothetical protein